MNNRGFMPLLTSRGRVAWTTAASPFLLRLLCTFTALRNATHVYFPSLCFFFSSFFLSSRKYTAMEIYGSQED